MGALRRRRLHHSFLGSNGELGFRHCRSRRREETTGDNLPKNDLRPLRLQRPLHEIRVASPAEKLPPLSLSFLQWTGAVESIKTLVFLERESGIRTTKNELKHLCWILIYCQNSFVLVMSKQRSFSAILATKLPANHSKTNNLRGRLRGQGRVWFYHGMLSQGGTSWKPKPS